MIFRFTFLLTLILFGFVAELNAQKPARHPEFIAPNELKPRVDFWIGVFARYGKHQVVMHHRRFPQAIYSVVDMAMQGASMNAVQFDIFKKKRVAEETTAIAAALRHLSSGAAPRNALDRSVQAALAKIPPGGNKYRLALEKDMIRSQTGIREKFADSIVRSGRYMHVLEYIFVKEFGLPVELTRLPFIESSFDYTAYSSVGAAGIWQFMPATAKSFGMQVGRVVDDRRDILIATRNAAKYLTQAYGSLGSWPLAVTSYNHGVAGVRRRIKSAGSNNIIRLIERTGEPLLGFASANFWPELIAALDVYDNYHTYFPNLVKDSPRYYITQTLNQAMSPAFASRKLGVPVDTLREYNYALTPAVWKGQFHIPKGYQLKIPKNMSSRVSALASAKQVVESSSVYGGVTYTVRRGDTLSKIARKYGVSVEAIKTLNKLRSDVVRVGQRLIVKESEARYVAPQQPKPARTVVTQQTTTSGTYVVKAGDSISGIAARHGLKIAELMQLNNLKSSAIRVGQTLKVKKPVHSSQIGSAPQQSRQTSTASSQTYTVQRGDTLWSISKKLNVSLAALKQANNLTRNNIKAGQRLKVPR